ncbi:hypothetical protein CBM2586_B130284 [Cupriavidus phytorum]|uniref:Uncharacterized protein n=1 Tax=Cupriavidus taiwanensis TaxID=164546 RepID=A0A975XHQ5_9BURK|nr:hypothetical protein CBM2586_B130284 [Cupriavidus taiwanensis]
MAPAVDGRDRAHHRHRHHQDQDLGGEEGRPLRRQRPEGVDQPRAAQRLHDPAGAHHAAGRREEKERGHVDLHGRLARGAEERPDRAPHPQHGQPRDQRTVLRGPGDSRGEPDRRRGQGFQVHPRWPQCRAHADRRRVHRRRLLVHGPGHEVREGTSSVRPPHRPEPGRAVPHRRVVHRTRGGQPDALESLRAVRQARVHGRAGQHGQVPGRQGQLGGRQRLPAVPRRLRLCLRIRCRAQVPRDAPVPGGADLDQPDLFLRRRARAGAAALVLSGTEVWAGTGRRGDPALIVPAMLGPGRRLRHPAPRPYSIAGSSGRIPPYVAHDCLAPDADPAAAGVGRSAAAARARRRLSAGPHGRARRAHSASP